LLVVVGAGLVSAADPPSSGGPTLIGKMDVAQIRLIATTGRNNMPTFRDIYDANQIRDVAEYITTVLPGKGAASVAKP